MSALLVLFSCECEVAARRWVPELRKSSCCLAPLAHQPQLSVQATQVSGARFTLRKAAPRVNHLYTFTLAVVRYLNLRHSVVICRSQEVKLRLVCVSTASPGGCGHQTSVGVWFRMLSIEGDITMHDGLIAHQQGLNLCAVDLNYSRLVNKLLGQPETSQPIALHSVTRVSRCGGPNIVGTRATTHCHCS